MLKKAYYHEIKVLLGSKLRQILLCTAAMFVPREVNFNFEIRTSPEFGRKKSTESEKPPSNMVFITEVYYISGDGVLE